VLAGLRCPQFDTSGEGILITTHDRVDHYVGMLTHQVTLVLLLWGVWLLVRFCTAVSGNVHLRYASFCDRADVRAAAARARARARTPDAH
jgi:hypothetical protein